MDVSVGIAMGKDANAFRKGRPLSDRLIEAQLGMELGSQDQMYLNRAFRKKNSGARLPNCHWIVLDIEHRELLSKVRGVKNFVFESMLFGATAGSADQRAIGRANHQPTCFEK